MATNDDAFAAAPKADGIQVFSCGDCTHPHIVLFDDDGKPLAQAVLPDQTLALLAGWWLGKGSPHK